jgi:hypothetical protein
VKSDYSSLIVGLMTDVLDEVDLSEYTRDETWIILIT